MNSGNRQADWTALCFVMLGMGLCKPLPADALLGSASREHYTETSRMGGGGLVSPCPLLFLLLSINAAMVLHSDRSSWFQYLLYSLN